MTVTEILEYLTDRLKDQLKAELTYDRERLLDRQHWLTLEQIFVEKKVYKRLEAADTQKKVHGTVATGMKAHAKLFVRPMVDEDVKRLLEIRIHRISAYDIEKNRAEVEDIVAQIEGINRKLRNMVRTTIEYVQGLIDKYGEQFPRRTHITRIESVDKKAVARQNVKLSYDKDSGFFGSAVRGDLFKMTVSEYDLILAIARDGSYRVMSPADKIYFSDKLLYCKLFDPDRGAHFTVVYRDKKRFCFGKRIHIERFIRNREYALIKDKAGKIDLLLEDDQTGVVSLSYPPAKRQRVKGTSFDLAELKPLSTGARGVRLAPKAVGRVGFQAAQRKGGTRAKARAEAPPTEDRNRETPTEGEQGDLFDD
jgi:topoisomerase-4 subunit A